MKLLALLLLASCSSAQTKDINKVHDDALIKPDAPWVWQAFDTQEQREALSQYVCKAPLKSLPEAEKSTCVGLIRDNMYSRWRTTYKYVNWNSFVDYCHSYPDFCANYKMAEAGLRETHNKEVERQRSLALGAADTGPSAIGSILGGMGAGLTGAAAAPRVSPTHCNTQRGAYGNVVTDCQ